jgi:outer membrane protein OmpA-like peptidoglycan-associated protein
MRKYALAILMFLLFLYPLHPAAAAPDPNDAEGSRDPALFNRMPGFYIANYKELDFDSYNFPVGPDEKTEPVEGHFYYAEYYPNEGVKIPSGLQIVRNYTNAAKAIGGEQVYEWDNGLKNVVLRIVKDTARVWAQVDSAADGTFYTVTIVEEQLMNQDVVADAKSLAGNINTDGKAAVYGIYFDTGKADLKPESDAALAEINKLLNIDSSLKLYVVGHTDNVGQFDYNLKLSQQRATSVVQALVSKGISASRLTPFGAGPVAPVTSNNTEEGRAKNRRVELVAQ